MVFALTRVDGYPSVGLYDIRHRATDRVIDCDDVA